MSPLAESIAARADEIDRDARIPEDIRRELVESGFFRLAVGAEFAGPALPLTEIIEAVHALGRADGSTAWTVVHAVDTAAFVPALPRSACELIYADGPDAVISGSGFDQGRAVPAGTDFRVSGTWRWVPDLGHADWYLVMAEDVAAAADGATPAALRMVLLAPRDVEVVDPVRTVGLRGSRTGTIRVVEALVPHEHTAAVPFTPCIDDRLRQLPVPPLSTLWYAAVALGIARGALDDLGAKEWEGGVRSQLMDMAGQDVLAARDVGEIAVRIEAAWAAMRFVADGLWSGQIASPRDVRKAEAMAISALRAAVDATTAVYHLGGDLAADVQGPLQRRLRDAHTFGQHHRFRAARYVTVGRQHLDTTDQSIATAVFA